MFLFIFVLYILDKHRGSQIVQQNLNFLNAAFIDVSLKSHLLSTREVMKISPRSQMIKYNLWILPKSM